ncbi:cytochrome c oxidase assembly protein CtaG/Cox11-domain-containing protein [Leucosporidium creatinivorum]|uniref:Cytochrome c oxidase assembly protein CtaG/Cox11-domain-containing protein n=1 Tax=Leucosporidium creatinivorum TaxID=106004 RepID=A0A1Y2CUI5_9BASI|nr:cytochrome c oxidase assembly protein CtaG/Cox11-domain-containing protein [Leucosporidium creatinivorum]
MSLSLGLRTSLRSCSLPSRPSRSLLTRRWASSAPPPPPPPPSRPSLSASPSASSRQSHYDQARQSHYKQRNRSLLLYSSATIILVTTASYLAVPLYRVFCSTTGYGGTPQTDSTRFSSDRLIPVSEQEAGRRIKVNFNADSSDSLPWSFTPQQRDVKVLPGETALAFYTATNNSEEDIIGIATYNVTPNNIAPYFAKVECFCFEEQRILAGEEVDLPVFFFIDRDFLDDPLMRDVREVTLSYTFFRARRDNYGNLVPSEGPLAVEGSVPAV